MNFLEWQHALVSDHKRRRFDLRQLLACADQSNSVLLAFIQFKPIGRHPLISLANTGQQVIRSPKMQPLIGAVYSLMRVFFVETAVIVTCCNVPIAREKMCILNIWCSMELHIAQCKSIS